MTGHLSTKYRYTQQIVTQQ